MIDPRGPQFNAILTSVVLALTLLTAPDPAGIVLLGLQAVLFRAAVLPRIGPPAEREDATPPRFAQAVGLGFAVVGLAGFLLGADLLGFVATGFALVAALLNAVFGFCLGCEIYLLAVRTRSRARSAAGLTSHVHHTSTTT